LAYETLAVIVFWDLLAHRVATQGAKFHMECRSIDFEELFLHSR
jgi:hypothetical protein